MEFSTILLYTFYVFIALFLIRISFSLLVIIIILIYAFLSDFFSNKSSGQRF